jgi:hypothetical protein
VLDLVARSFGHLQNQTMNGNLHHGGGFSDRGPINERSQNRVILKIPGTATQPGGVYYLFGDKVKNLPADQTGADLKPWDIINFTGSSGSVWPGTVAGIMPSNLFANGELARFSVGNGIQKWKAKCLTDGKQITSVQIVVDAQDPPAQQLVPSALPAEAWFVFGVTFAGSVFRTLGPGNPSVTLNQAVVTDKTTAPPPGVPGVDRWYRVNFT